MSAHVPACELLADIAAAIAAKPSEYASLLIENLLSVHPSSRVLAQLALAQVIRSIKGDQQVSLALAALTSLEPHLTGLRLRSEIEIPTLPALLEAISGKLDGAQTSARVAASLLASLGAVVKPKGAIDWLSEAPAPVDATSYKLFARKAYALANSPSLHDNLARHLLRSLFTQLGKNALMFFASVWTDSTAAFTLRVAALKHATAFVGAHAVGTDGAKVDFQMVVPALVVAMHDAEQALRAAAIELLKLVAQAPQEIVEVYGLDTLYGSRSGECPWGRR